MSGEITQESFVYRMPRPKLGAHNSRRTFLQRAFAAVLFALGPSRTASSAELKPARKIIAFGDSIIAGLGLRDDDTLPAALERALRKEGYNVTIVNAGVSGETASSGLARLGWTIADGADGVILELGANDMLRGINPEVTQSALDAILASLKARNIRVLLAGMKAAPGLGPEYQRRFDAIYPALAKKYDVSLYPFVLEGVAGVPALNQNDGMHPNSAGVEIIVERILPQVRALVN